MNRPSTRADAKVSARSKKGSRRKRLATVIASLFLASGSIVAVTAVPAAAGATNNYYCSYWTGYCRLASGSYNAWNPNYCYVRTDVYYGYGMHESNCDKIFY